MQLILFSFLTVSFIRFNFGSSFVFYRNKLTRDGSSFAYYHRNKCRQRETVIVKDQRLNREIDENSRLKAQGGGLGETVAGAVLGSLLLGPFGKGRLTQFKFIPSYPWITHGSFCFVPLKFYIFVSKEHCLELH